jgi:integrase/recombinase XerD
MTTLEATTTAMELPEREARFDEAQLAAVAFLTRYSGRTLDAYRHDLRMFFQWGADNGLEVLQASRPHIELYRSAMEERGLAAATIDRRLSTVCGFYRFAHIDGRIPSNPAQYVRRPKVQPNEGHGMDRGELGTFLFTAERFDCDHAALAVLLGLNGLRVSEACGTNVEDLGCQRGHRTLRILGRATSPPRSRSCPEPPGRSTSQSANATRAQSCAAGMGSVSTVAPPTGGSVPSVSVQGSEPSTHTCSVPASSWPPSMPACPCGMSRSPPATPTLGPPRSTTGAERTSTGTPPTSSSPSWREADDPFIPPRAAPRGWPTGVDRCALWDTCSLADAQTEPSLCVDADRRSAHQGKACVQRALAQRLVRTLKGSATARAGIRSGRRVPHQ